MSGEQGAAAPSTAVTPEAVKPPSQRLLTVLVFVCGSASLGGEIASLRLLAPFFGSSTIVWANTIAVVLLALSLGYFLGGRLADTHPHLRGLCSMIGVAALLYAIVPVVASPFLRVSVKLVDASSFGTLAGSLVSVIVLVALPMTLLGAVSPWALRLALHDVDHSGRVSGRLYAISTAGSLLGIMLATLVLIPFTGSRRTFFVFALALAVIAAIGIARGRYAAVPAAIAVVALLPIGPLQPATPGDKVLFEGETPFQYVRVVERSNEDVFLELNQSNAVHSMYRPGSYLTGQGSYWDHILVLPLSTLDGPPERVAILGNAAGTMARSIGHFYPGAEVHGVEIDPKLTELGYRFFDLHNPKLTMFHEDARPWLERSDGNYDAIVMDAYQPEYIPFYLATKEFFALVRDRLSDDGAFVLNLDHPEDDDDLERVLGRTMSEAFPNVRRRTLSSTTTLLVGSKADIEPERMHDNAVDIGLPSELLDIATGTATDLRPRLDGGEVFTDDRAPVEFLVDLSEY